MTSKCMHPDDVYSSKFFDWFERGANFNATSVNLFQRNRKHNPILAHNYYGWIEHELKFFKL